MIKAIVALLLLCLASQGLASRLCRRPCTAQRTSGKTVMCRAQCINYRLTSKMLPLADSEAFAFAGLGNGDTLVATTGLNIRAGPCTNTAIIGSLSNGESAVATGETANGCGYTWYKLTRGGWVARDFVNVRPGGGGGIKAGTTLVANTGVNLRAGPCTNTAIVGGLSPGQSVTAAGQQASGCGYTWYKLTSGSWVAKDFVNVGGGGGGGGGGSCRARNYPLFKQCNSAWGGQSLGSSSVCAIGCLMNSVAMALNGLGKRLPNGQEINPGTLNGWLKGNGGYQGNLYVWTPVNRFGVAYQGQIRGYDAIKDRLCRGQIVILNVNNGGHWVLATGIAPNGDFLVNDPGFARTSYRANEVGVAGIYTV